MSKSSLFRSLPEPDQSQSDTYCRLQKRIAAMEDAAVGEKPWQLAGEVAGPARPENSLLQEHLEYDTAARQAPVITEEVSQSV